ncbi:hypothetical protein HQ560_08480 [bacterium]|nr:hypothetical protein [bacterium]
MTPGRLSIVTLARLVGFVGLGLLAGCPSPDTNPAVLWLGLDGSETRVRLVEDEPPPF